MRLSLLPFAFLIVQAYAQKQPHLDFTRVEAEIKPYSDNRISGIVRYDFTVNSSVTSISFDAVDMEFSNVYLGTKKVTDEIEYDGKTLQLKGNLEKGKHKVTFGFVAKPKQTVYFMGWNDHLEGNDQIWTQGQGKYTSHWLPSFDDMNEKVEFDLTFHVPPKYTVISNGKLKEVKTTDTLKTWKYDMTQPMSSYLTAFAIGDFDKKVMYSASGVPIELYFEPKDSLKVEPTYRHSKAIFDFLEKEIGVAYPWQNYKQVPVQDFLYAGMENTGCTIFSNQYVVDSIAFIDKNYVNVNAHELAHQWFGNLVTEVSGKHHWLHEGFATYYAYLSEKQLFGNAHFYWKLYATAQTLNKVSGEGEGEALTDPGAGSLTFYEKGAWALVMLRERVGELTFRQGIKSYLEKYAFKNATISNFLAVMTRVAKEDLSDFREEWLENDEFPWESVKNYLASKEPSLKLFFELQEKVKDTKVTDQKLHQFFNSETPEPLKRQILFEWYQKIPDSSLAKIIQHEPLKVRQAAALAIPKIPEQMKSEFESMLSDQSYVTQEAVLFKLWEAFPANRSKYLDQLDGVVGLPNKNVRLLWLTLALVTPEYQPESKKAYFEELNGYTAEQFNFEVRQLAFQYLYQIGALSDVSLRNLIKACDHHVWQFKKSSRNLIRELNKSQEGKTRLNGIKIVLPDQEKQLLEKVITP